MAVAQPSALNVQLEAPAAIRELLEQHVRLLNNSNRMLPEADADRSALARRSRREIRNLLATEGYFSPTIRLNRDKEQGREQVWRIVIEPGPRTEIGTVSIQFEGELNDGSPENSQRIETLRKGWRLPSGQAFRQTEWDTAKQALLNDVSSHRYATARILQSQATIDPETTTARLSITIDSGPSFFLGPLQVEGLQDLPSDFVERFNTLKPGEPFDRDALLAFQRALQNTPQLASVVVDIERDVAQAAAAPVRVNVVEAMPKRTTLGTGFSTNTGYRVEARYQDVNLFGQGLELDSAIRLEQRRQLAYADIFLLPSPKGHRDSVGIQLDRSNLEGLRIETETLGVSRAALRGNIKTVWTARVQHETLRPDGVHSSEDSTIALNWTWIRFAVDQVMDPRSGHVLEFQAGGGTNLSLERRDFFRLYSRYMHYLPLSERDNLILRIEGGTTFAESRDYVPQDFLFRTGGTQTIRGYAYQSLGVSEGSATVGGRYLAIASAEYVRWLTPQWGVAFFTDTGDAADSPESFRLHTGYGSGVRWRSPLGPLAADLAWGHQDQRLRLHLGIAIAF